MICAELTYDNHKVDDGFRVNQESLIAPVWVSLLGFPLPFFEKKLLFKIGSLIGMPLQMDSTTISLKQSSVTRLLIEINVAKVPVKRLWLGDNEFGQWQRVEL